MYAARLPDAADLFRLSGYQYCSDGHFSAPWVDADHAFPIWSYFTFTQNFFMAGMSGIGAHWLSPTWTLAVEEHFYLIVPFLFSSFRGAGWPDSHRHRCWGAAVFVPGSMIS
jgi:peptidoglycan/LPS O-acetylase OafA/YrhL